MLSSQGVRNAPKVSCEPFLGVRPGPGRPQYTGARVTLQVCSGASVPREVDVGTWPHRVGQALLAHPHVGPLGSESGLCVQGCLWCAEGGPFHCCLLVEQPMAGLGVSLRAPWEELCWASVSLYIWKWVRSPSLCVYECPRTLGSWGLFLCPVWLLT